MFEKPQVGQRVTVITQYRDHYRHAPSPYKRNVYKDVQVLPNEEGLSPDDFIIESDDPLMRSRVINLKNVVELYVEGQVAGQVIEKAQPSTKTVNIAGSKGTPYQVQIVKGKVVSCTCPQHMIRKQFCKHTKTVQEVEDDK